VVAFVHDDPSLEAGWAWRDEVIVELRARALVLLLAAPPALAGGGADGTPPPEPALETERAFALFVARPDEPVTRYRARRRMEARALGKRAWMEVRVELDPEAGFRWWVESEGGSRALIERCFLKLLRLEAEGHASGLAESSALTSANYDFAPEGRTPEGLVRLRARPRRKEASLIDGSFVITPDTADIVRVEGKLARAPSFWIPKVQLSRHYVRIGSHRIVTRLESTASLRLIGSSFLVVTYDYDMIDGDQIVAAARTASASPPVLKTARSALDDR
jgi:hypothetical protein